MGDLLQKKLKGQFATLKNLVDGLGPRLLETRHQPHRWSIHENIAHLGRYQEVFRARLSRIIGEDTPVFDRYNAQADSAHAQWAALGQPEIFKKMKAERLALSKCLGQLSEKSFNRVGIHPKLGRLNIHDWAMFFLLHESHHLYTIFWLIHQNKGPLDAPSHLT